ncbi:MAG TPA: M28 family metallopeptidase [Thermoanaerobaculia bacterium]|nr:M28 family metallopeptidase [Thermoanaerobaculia bacterium]
MYLSRVSVFALIAFVATSLHAAAPQPPIDAAADAARQRIRPEAIAAHIHFLASDLLDGRETGTHGFDVAAQYVAAQFAALGLEPMGDRGGWLQVIDFRRCELIDAESSLVVRQSGSAQALIAHQDCLLHADPLRERTEVTAPVVFVGFGIVAPELGYDDYTNIDVRGRIVLQLTGAPPKFPTDQRAYYSSNEIKARVAADRGAIGVLRLKTSVDETRYPFAKMARQSGIAPMVALDAQGRPLQSIEDLRGAAAISRSGAEILFRGAPMTVDAVLAAAEKGTTRSFALATEATITTRTRLQTARSANVVALLRGSDPVLRNEYVVFSAHLDHLGRHAVDGTERIYNGALDNGSGIASLIEIARAFSSLGKAPRRSILFVAVTGEEKGEQGSQIFASRPPVPAGAIVADINMDMFMALYPVADLIAFGSEHSTLAATLQRAAAHLGLPISPDPNPEEVRFIRSDQFSFVKAGIPSIIIKGGTKSGDPAIDGEAATREWLHNVYHTPKDNLAQHIDFASGATYAQTNFLVGYLVANANERPRWNNGDFFGERFAKHKAAGVKDGIRESKP